MEKDFVAEIKQHQLKREIIATVVTNDVINRSGITLIHALAEDSGMSHADVVRAYVAATQAFGLRDLWDKVEALDGKVTVDVQIQLFNRLALFAKHITQWFMRNAPQPLEMADDKGKFVKGIKAYADCYESIISAPIAEDYKQKVESLSSAKVPAELAKAVAVLDIMSSAPDVVLVSSDRNKKLADVGKLYFEIGAMLRLEWLRQQAEKIVSVSHWDDLAISSIASGLLDEQRRLTASVVAGASLEKWSKEHEADIARFNAFIDELKGSEALSLQKLVMAEKKIKEVAR
jgi:glutamate dehydrogenase